jgi:predicted permease
MVEGVLIALAGGVLGFTTAFWSIGWIVKLLPVRLPVFSVVQVDSRVFAFTTSVSVLAGALLGLAAAVRGSRDGFDASFKSSMRSSHGRLAVRTGGLLVMGEIAVAIIVTVGAGLLLRSFQELRHVDPGFEPDHLLTVRFDLPKRYAGDARLRVVPEIAERVASLAQIQTAAVTIMDPFVWAGINRGITVDGHTPLSAMEQDEIYVQEVSPRYFEAMKIGIRAGRDFTLRDNADASHVVIVSHAFSRRYWPGQEAVGKRLKYGPANSKYEWMEVVGEVDDVRFTSLRADPNASSIIYAPLMQSEVIVNASVVARTKTDPASVISTVREAIQKFDPEIPVYSMATMASRIEGETETTRSFGVLLATFAFMGVGLAAVGTYAAMAARVSGRTREIGIRMALGADPKAIVRMILSQGALLAVAGVLIGVGVALWASRLLATQLYGVRPTDPLTFMAAAALLSMIAAAACWIPARRAMRVEPIIALKAE